MILLQNGVVKGKWGNHSIPTKEEILEKVAKHKEVVKARYSRRRDLRKKREHNKKVAAKAAENKSEE